MTAPPTGGPPECEKPAPRQESRSSHHVTDVAESSDKELVWVPCTRPPTPQDAVSQLRRRRAGAHRSVPLDCGCRDPWTHRPAPGGYAEAAQHLADRGLLAAPPATVAELRELWRDDDTRELAQWIAAGWAVTA